MEICHLDEVKLNSLNSIFSSPIDIYSSHKTYILLASTNDDRVVISQKLGRDLWPITVQQIPRKHIRSGTLFSLASSLAFLILTDCNMVIICQQLTPHFSFHITHTHQFNNMVLVFNNNALPSNNGNVIFHFILEDKISEITLTSTSSISINSFSWHSLTSSLSSPTVQLSDVISISSTQCSSCNDIILLLFTPQKAYLFSKSTKTLSPVGKKDTKILSTTFYKVEVPPSSTRLPTQCSHVDIKLLCLRENNSLWVVSVHTGIVQKTILLEDILPKTENPLHIVGHYLCTLKKNTVLYVSLCSSTRIVLTAAINLPLENDLELLSPTLYSFYKFQLRKSDHYLWCSLSYPLIIILPLRSQEREGYGYIIEVFEGFIQKYNSIMKEEHEREEAGREVNSEEKDCRDIIIANEFLNDLCIKKHLRSYFAFLEKKIKGATSNESTLVSQICHVLESIDQQGNQKKASTVSLIEKLRAILPSTELYSLLFHSSEELDFNALFLNFIFSAQKRKHEKDEKTNENLCIVGKEIKCEGLGVKTGETINVKGNLSLNTLNIFCDALVPFFIKSPPTIGDLLAEDSYSTVEFLSRRIDVLLETNFHFPAFTFNSLTTSSATRSLFSILHSISSLLKEQLIYVFLFIPYVSSPHTDPLSSPSDRTIQPAQSSADRTPPVMLPIALLLVEQLMDIYKDYTLFQHDDLPPLFGEDTFIILEQSGINWDCIDVHQTLSSTKMAPKSCTKNLQFTLQLILFLFSEIGTSSVVQGSFLGASIAYMKLLERCSDNSTRDKAIIHDSDADKWHLQGQEEEQTICDRKLSVVRNCVTLVKEDLTWAFFLLVLFGDIEFCKEACIKCSALKSFGIFILGGRYDKQEQEFLEIEQLRKNNGNVNEFFASIHFLCNLVFYFFQNTEYFLSSKGIWKNNVWIKFCLQATRQRNRVQSCHFVLIPHELIILKRFIRNAPWLIDCCSQDLVCEGDEVKLHSKKLTIIQKLAYLHGASTDTIMSCIYQAHLMTRVLELSQ